MAVRYEGDWDNYIPCDSDRYGDNEAVCEVYASMSVVHSDRCEFGGYMQSYLSHSGRVAKIILKMTYDEWSSGSTRARGIQLLEELRVLMQDGVMQEGDVLIRHLGHDDTNLYKHRQEAVTMYTPTTERSNEIYLERIAHAVSVKVLKISLERDNSLRNTPETVRIAVAQVYGEDFANSDDYILNAERDANDRLDSIIAGQVKYLEKHGCNQVTYRKLGDMWKRVTELASLGNGRNTIHTVRVAEVVQKALMRVAALSGYAMPLAYYAVTCLAGAVRRAAHSRDEGAVERAIYKLELLNQGDYDEVEEFLVNEGYSRCGDCSNWEAHNEMRYPRNYEDGVCRECINDNYVYSEYYAEYIVRDQSMEALDEEGNRCIVDQDDDCFIWSDSAGMSVHEHYSHTTHLLRRYHSAKNEGAYKLIHSPFTDTTKRFMGVELEVEASSCDISDRVEELNDTINGGVLGSRVFFEEDGSLTHGFEIITQPMGLDTHAALWEWLNDDDLTDGLKSHDTSTCGLHIHINKSALTAMQIDKMNVFLNHPDNAKLVEKVSRRYSASYARITHKKLGHSHQRGSGDRYEALNITNNSTVEIRVFKGTLKYTSLMAALEFANALVNFTAPASPAGFRLDAKTFSEFIELPAYRNETKYLRNLLAA